MDKEFWHDIIKSNYKFPEEHSLDELTDELFSYLGSTDPELRDGIGYIVYANWLGKGMYARSDILKHIQMLFDNLKNGVGQTDTDSVFLRSFAALFLAEIVHYTNKESLLDKEKIREILENGLEYLQAEKDPRGHVLSKGWAHALAHTADLLKMLAKNEHTDLDEHSKILNGIAEKLVNAFDCVYIHGEDDRLADVVVSILRRGTLSMEAFNEWLERFNAPQGGTWKGAWTKEESTRAFQNVRNFLQSLHLKITDDEQIDDQLRYQRFVFSALQSLKAY